MKPENEKMLRGIIATAIMLLAITYADLLIVEGVFRPSGVWELIGNYHKAMFLVMAYAIFASGFILTRDWRFSIYLYLLLLFNVEDTLYFVLGGMKIPDELPWLWGVPTRTELFIRNFVALLLMVLAEAVDRKYRIWENLLERATEPGAYFLCLSFMFAISSTIWSLFPAAC